MPPLQIHLHLNHPNTHIAKDTSKKKLPKNNQRIVEKNGIRSVERFIEHHHDTIDNLIEDMAEHAEQLNQTLLKELNLTHYEMDELWTTVKKTKKEA